MDFNKNTFIKIKNTFLANKIRKFIIKYDFSC